MNDSSTIEEYKQTMFECIKQIKPYITREQIEPVLDYSIQKRMYSSNAIVNNTYSKKQANMSLLSISDYIKNKEPIVTAGGTLFIQHEKVDNPMAKVVQMFLDKRGEYKKSMFSYPKGSEQFDHYNMMQSLEKISANAIYGTLGAPTSLLYDLNVATSVTMSGRSLVSSMSLFFESFLANSVKLGSLNEVMEFINHVCKEKYERKFNDYVILDNPNVTPINCFVKVVMSCGYRWIPTDEELEIIWQTINNLGQQDITRLYYKNNLYEFMSNNRLKRIMIYIMQTLEEPFLNPNKPPENILPALDELTDLLREYVYYRYMYIDRIDRCDNMIKSVIMISDTDSTIVSLDAWYKFNLEYLKDLDFPIKKVAVKPIDDIEFDEFGDITPECRKKFFVPVSEFDPEYDYDFVKDELVEMKHTEKPYELLPQDNVRHSILNILAYALDHLVNDYMEKYCENNHSFDPKGSRKCKIIAKNEFTFKRLLMTPVKKSYATLQEVQEGNMIPKDKQLDIKGIAALAKSSMSEKTRDSLKKILLEDVLTAEDIDQFTVVKHIAVLEKQIIQSVMSGSKEFYKPVTIKSASSYENPLRIQGIKASMVWNALKDDELPAINLDERNAIDIAKVKINKSTVEQLREKYPDTYQKAVALLNDEIYKGNIDAIAIPLDVQVPSWLLEMIDYTTIVNNNIGGFVFDSIGIKRFGRKNVNYTNILQL